LLSLARGLLLNAQIFIFDEATSNVDPKSESLMNRALKELLADKTQIRIAHRLQTVEDCDQILWLDNGKIKMLGPTQEVLETFRKSR
jgi:ABC-type multidrug transport system fused ATPase/permease subunit